MTAHFLTVILTILVICAVATSTFVPFPDVSFTPLIVNEDSDERVTIDVRLLADTSKYKGTPGPDRVTIEPTRYVLLTWVAEAFYLDDRVLVLMPNVATMMVRALPLNNIRVELRPMGLWHSGVPPPLSPVLHSGVPPPLSSVLHSGEGSMLFCLSKQKLGISEFSSFQFSIPFSAAAVNQYPSGTPVGTLGVEIGLVSNEQDPAAPIPPFFSSIPIVTARKPHTLPADYIPTGSPATLYRKSVTPKLDWTRISPAEPLFGNLLPLWNNYKPWEFGGNHLFRWAVHIPWNLWLGGFNRPDGSVFGGVRPNRIKLSAFGGSWLVNNSTTPLSQPGLIKTTCLINDIEVAADMVRTKIVYPVPGGDGALERERIDLNLLSNRAFWDSLLGPFVPKTTSTISPAFGLGDTDIIQPPLMLANFTITCPSAPLYIPNIENPSLADNISIDTRRGIAIDLGGETSGGYLKGAVMLAEFNTIATQATSDYNVKIGASSELFSRVPSHWVQYSGAKPHVGNGIEATKLLQPQQPSFKSTPPIPFPLVIAPTNIVLKQAPDPTTTATTITAIITMVIEIESLLRTSVDVTPSTGTNTIRISFTNPGNPGRKLDTFSPINQRSNPLIIFLEPLQNNPEAKTWALETYWSSSQVFQTDEVKIPPELITHFDPDTPLPGVPRRTHFKISFSVDLQGRNPWTAAQNLAIINQVDIVIAPANCMNGYGPDSGIFRLLQPLPITRWFRDSQKALEHHGVVFKPNYDSGTSFFDIPYSPAQWDLHIDYTGLDGAEFTLSFGGSLGPKNAIPDVIQEVTLHTTGLYLFTTTTTATTADELRQLIQLDCHNHRNRRVDCDVLNVSITPTSINFQIRSKASTTTTPKMDHIPSTIKVYLDATLKFIPRAVTIVNESGYPVPPPTIINLVATIIVQPPATQPKLPQEQSKSQMIHLALSYTPDQDPMTVFSALGGIRFTPEPKSRPKYFWPLIAALALALIVALFIGYRLWVSFAKIKKEEENDVVLEQLLARDTQERDERERSMQAMISSMGKALEATLPPIYTDLGHEHPLPEYDHDLESSCASGVGFQQGSWNGSGAATSFQFSRPGSANPHNQQQQPSHQESVPQQQSNLSSTQEELEPIPYNDQWTDTTTTTTTTFTTIPRDNSINNGSSKTILKNSLHNSSFQ